ncbi:hypothetical protein FisN_12Lh285 [Fistulifera solaris]|jgi:hypothetical protein|uniref:Uncharacterized protein n=1 Tax=Fistulifera solaris TaxID=1519565 RepID=A0A1Z5JM21_FISSO|nr:hypothetical protein FisN_12Lh285 [Fistulifera solaris]|eukprot:GAX15019.1 hypothetical protein FisN_12Lh285 [Fistulifera solaris]
MSERMIELQRARLLASKGAASSAAVSSGAAGTNGSQITSPVSGIPAMGSESVASHQTPQEAALAAMRTEDMHMQRFLHKLQDRNDAKAQSTSGPTVPVVLSRRMLQRQGVGYLDETVAALVSGAADRFLGTVLQQAMVCRGQRLKGAEMAKEARNRRKRHIAQYDADTAERRRRKQEREEQREQDNLAAIGAAEALKKGSKRTDNLESPSKSKKKKQDELSKIGNGAKLKKDNTPADGDDESYDSIDEEEDYYRDTYGDASIGESQDVEEDEDDTLILRDLSRPLEAWGFCLDGKAGMEPMAADESDADDDDSESAEDADEGNEINDDDESDEDMIVDTETKKSTQNASNAAKSPDTEKGSRKTATSPKPQSRAPTPVKLN